MSTKLPHHLIWLSPQSPGNSNPALVCALSVLRRHRASHHFRFHCRLCGQREFSFVTAECEHAVQAGVWGGRFPEEFIALESDWNRTDGVKLHTGTSPNAFNFPSPAKMTWQILISPIDPRVAHTIKEKSERYGSRHEQVQQHKLDSSKADSCVTCKTRVAKAESLENFLKWKRGANF